MHPSCRMNLTPQIICHLVGRLWGSGQLWHVVWAAVFIKGANSVEMLAEIEGKTYFFSEEYLVYGPVLSMQLLSFFYSSSLPVLMSSNEDWEISRWISASFYIHFANMYFSVGIKRLEKWMLYGEMYVIWGNVKVKLFKMKDSTCWCHL